MLVRLELATASDHATQLTDNSGMNSRRPTARSATGCRAASERPWRTDRASDPEHPHGTRRSKRSHSWDCEIPCKRHFGQLDTCARAVPCDETAVSTVRPSYRMSRSYVSLSKIEPGARNQN